MTTAPTESFDLTDDLAILLDGRVDAKQQTRIDAAKRRIEMRTSFAALTDAERKLLNQIADCARNQGLLQNRASQLRLCKVCGESGGYHTVKRSSRYKTRGELDYDSPKYLSGIEFQDSFVTMKGYISTGACKTCVDRLMPHIETVLADLPHERKWWPGQVSKWKRNRNHLCTKCGWTGHEGEMRRTQTLVGDVDYPSGCPNCAAENRFFGPTEVKIVDGFVCTPLNEPKPPVE